MRKSDQMNSGQWFLILLMTAPVLIFKISDSILGTVLMRSYGYTYGGFLVPAAFLMMFYGIFTRTDNPKNVLKNLAITISVPIALISSAFLFYKYFHPYILWYFVFLSFCAVAQICHFAVATQLPKTLVCIPLGMNIMALSLGWIQFFLKGGFPLAVIILPMISISLYFPFIFASKSIKARLKQQ